MSPHLEGRTQKELLTHPHLFLQTPPLFAFECPPDILIEPLPTPIILGEDFLRPTYEIIHIRKATPECHAGRSRDICKLWNLQVVTCSADTVHVGVDVGAGRRQHVSHDGCIDADTVGFQCRLGGQTRPAAGKAQGGIRKDETE